MTAVREELDRALVDAVRRHGIVAWLDPERAFSDVAVGVDVGDAKVHVFDGSYYALQHELLRLIDSEARPKIVVYLSGVDTLTGTPLLELGAMGGMFKSDLKKIARTALTKVNMPKARIDALLATPNLTLEIVESAIAVEIGVPEALRAIFGGASNEDLLFRVMSEPAVVKQVERAGVTSVLAAYLGSLLATSLPEDTAALVDALWEWVLVTEFVSDLPRRSSAPPAAAERSSKDTNVQRLCNKIADRLRLRDDRREEYRNRSGRIAERLGLADAPIDALSLGSIDTFEFEESRVLAGAIERTLAGDLATGRALITKRKDTFWLRLEPRKQAAWNAAELAIELIERIEQVRRTLPPASATASTWVKFYVQGCDGAAPLAELDSLSRRTERQVAAAAAQELTPLIDRARSEYQAIVQTTAERFADSISRDKGDAFLDQPKQSAIFHDCVEPLLATGPVAYILCDALRYEMAADLRGRFMGEKGVKVELEPRIGTLPSVTEIGMTALLPGAERGLELVATGGKLGLRIGDAAVFDRKGRIALLETRFGSKVRVVDLGEYTAGLRSSASPAKGKRAGSRGRRDLPELLVAFWGDIDAMGEHGSLEPLRAYFSELVDRLAQMIRELSDAGFRHVVIASDHGHLFTEIRGKEMEIEPPLGTPLDAQRRHWVGRVGKTSADHIALAASDVGLGGELELVFPRGLAAMRFAKKVFFHGGLSLQELIVPAMTLSFPAEEPDRDGRTFFVLLDEGASVSEQGFIVGQLEYVGTSLLDDKSIDVQLVGTVDGQVVTRLATAQGSTPGTDLIKLIHGKRVLFLLELRARGRGRIRLELRTRDGGRVLNLSQPPPELDFDLAGPAIEQVVETSAASPLAATSIALEIGASKVVVDLGFEPSEDERRILQALSRDGMITEVGIGRLLGKKGGSFLLAALIQKLLEHGHRFIEQGDDSDEGATYTFQKHRVRRGA